MAYAYNSSYSGGRIRRITVRGQGKINERDFTSTNKPGMMVHTYDPSYVGSTGRMTVVQSQPHAKIRNPFSNPSTAPQLLAKKEKKRV
jgi:hypothetical protein